MLRTANVAVRKVATDYKLTCRLERYVCTVLCSDRNCQVRLFFESVNMRVDLVQLDLALNRACHVEF